MKNCLSAKKTAFREVEKTAFFEATFSRNFFRARKIEKFLPTFSDGFFRLLRETVKKSEKAQKKWANGQKFLKSGQAETVDT